MTPTEVLDLPLDDHAANQSGAETIRGYLVALVARVWDEGEGFSGKRPFGNSGWEWDLHPTLIRAGVITGTFDEDGYVEDSDDAAAHRVIADAIKTMATSDVG